MPPPPSVTFFSVRLEELDSKIEALRSAHANASASQAARIATELVIAESEKLSIEGLLRL